MTPSYKDQYLEKFAANCIASVNLTKKKCADYTGDAESPYHNFEAVAQLLGVDAEFVILVMLATKLVRAHSLLNRDAQNESVEDTYRDMMTYANIALTRHQFQAEYYDDPAKVENFTATSDPTNVPQSPSETPEAEDPRSWFNRVFAKFTGDAGE